MTEILSSDGSNRAIKRIAHQILEKNQGGVNLVLIGILTGGKELTLKLAAAIEDIEGYKVDVGFVDVRGKRDDISPAERERLTTTSESHIAVPIDKKTVVLVDDVLFTGRTVRAAMDVLLTMGRPDKIQLATLIDRGHRELPIRPDFVGKNIPTSRAEKVIVSTHQSQIVVVLEK